MGFQLVPHFIAKVIISSEDLKIAIRILKKVAKDNLDINLAILSWQNMDLQTELETCSYQTGITHLFYHWEHHY